MKMEEKFNAKELKKLLEETILFPGSLKELNKIEGKRKRFPLRKTFDYLDPNRKESYLLVGTLIPGEYDFESVCSQKFNRPLSVTPDMLKEAKDKNKEPEYDNKNNSILYSDIRYKTKKIGADALVEFRLFSPKENGLYMGVPVKIKCKKK